VSLNGRRLAADLSSALGVEARLANDANCFALAEATLGAAARPTSSPRPHYGSGVGSGIVVDGRVLHGSSTGSPGECGPTNPVLRLRPRRAYLRRVACVEDGDLGSALERFYHARTGEPRTLPDITTSRRPRVTAARSRDVRPPDGEVSAKGDCARDQHPPPRDPDAIR
jgi:predicted NBD/HSP70 family sugar kinase